MSNTNMEQSNEQMLISYTLLRKIIGWLGMFLPVALVIGAYFYSCKTIESSVSDYYHTEMRNLLVGVLCAVALFMFTYNGEDKRDKYAGNLACVFALGVAFFPTSIDPDSFCATNCIAYEAWIKWAHYIFAALFFSVLIYFSLVLFIEPRHENDIKTKLHEKRNKVFRACGYIMIACVILIAVYHFLLKDKYPELKQLDLVFWLEWMALWAFGVSWLTKGQMILKG